MAITTHHVSLNEVPATLQVPDDLQARFWYDHERKQLCFDGFMSKCTYDRLEKLSEDRSYQRALEDLFRVSVPATTARPRRGWRRLAPW